MSRFRTSSPVKRLNLHLATKVPAIALAAALAGGIGVWSLGATAQPATVANRAGQAAAVEQWASAHPLVPATAHAAAGVIAPPGHAAAAASAGRAHPAKVNAVLLVAMTETIRLTPRAIARRLLSRFGWRLWQFRYLNLLWSRESSWNVHAYNPYSGAYGIPQAAPGSKMASAGPNWRTSARTQILWGMRYIKSRYGTPHRAWMHECGAGWY